MRKGLFVAGAFLALTIGFNTLPAAAVPNSNHTGTKAPKCFGQSATDWLDHAGTLHLTAGSDVLVGSGKADSFVVDEEGGIDLVCAQGGDDVINYVVGDGSKVDGGSGKDTIYVYHHAWATGSSGNDTMYAHDGSTVYGDSGNDHLEAIDGSTAFGGSGNDTIVATNLSVGYGDSGNDDMTGDSAGAFYGDSGNDDIQDTTGGPFIDCGSGKDTAYTYLPAETIHCENYSNCACLTVPDLDFFAVWLKPIL